MKNKLINYFIQYLVIIWTSYFTIYLNGCGDADSTTTIDGDSIVFLNIDSVIPIEVPQLGGNFDITVRAGGLKKLNVNSINAKLTFKKFDNFFTDSCYATEINFPLESREPITHRIHTTQFSSCGPGMYRVQLTSSSQGFSNIFSNYIIFWGHVELPVISAKLGATRMENTVYSQCNSSISSIIQTYNNTSEDSNRSYINIIPSQQITEVREENFWGITDYATLLFCLDTFMTDNRVTNDSFQICFAKTNYVTATNNHVIGLSSNFTQSPHYHNFSFIFMDKIADVLKSGWDEQSCKNAVSNHELMHQVGNQHGAHELHGNPFKKRCVYWSPLDCLAVTGDITRLNSFFRICDPHILDMRTYLLTNNIEAAGKPSFNSKLNFFDSPDYTINISLPKYRFKKYEPIIAKFEVINKENASLIINPSMFDPFSEKTVSITDDEGFISNTNKFTFVPSTVSADSVYVLEPYDTLLVSMPINNWGASLNSNNYKDYIFDNWGYFPPGHKYKVKYDANGKLSNEAEFEVEELTNNELEEFNILKTELSSEHFREFLKDYPENIFSEYIDAEILKKSYYTALFVDSVPTSLIVDYENFFKKYISSNYLYLPIFMDPYFIAQYSRNNFLLTTNQIINKGISQSFSNYFSMRNINKLIKLQFRFINKYYKKHK